MRKIPFLALMVILLPQLSFCANFDLSGKPTIDPDPEDVNPFDVISKQKKEDIILTSGRSAGSKKLYQGDIVLDEESLPVGLGRTTRQDNVVLLWPRKIWNSRIVPYKISGHSYDGIKKIKDGMRDLEKKICVRFRPLRNGDKAWLDIYNGDSCWANIGRSIAFGKTRVSLGAPLCLSRTLVQHEIIHALGFFHEQARRDRDNYVKILKWNISPANLYNFDKGKEYRIDTFGLPYDYQSIMHYSRTTWTKNGKDTMQAKNDPNLELGGTKLSKYDIMKLNAMYHCHEKPGTVWTEWSEWSKCLKNYHGCYRSKHRICLTDNLSLCPEADEFGVHSIPQKCPSESHCNVEQVDGFWGSWSKWSSCSRACDRGSRTRSRKCDSPKPSGGGIQCKGPRTDTEKCMRRTCNNNKYFTNFDTGLGVWSNVPGHKDPLDWKRGRGRSGTSTGPVSDHTDGNGWYLYVSSASYTTHQKKANLVSEYLSGFKCLSFAYCMNGKNMGRIDVAIKLTNGQWVIFFVKKGHQGIGWHHADISLNNPLLKKHSYRIFIEAKVGYSPNSDIAIDDLFIENGPCDAGNKKPIPSNQKPTKPVVNIGCKNKHLECSIWANLGECHLNPSFMLKACCLTCRGMGDCKKDSYSATKCPEWASKGECAKNPKWMWKNCCKSCKTLKSLKKCPGPDKDDRCKQWAASGECKKNSDWMSSNCCNSCKALKSAEKCPGPDKDDRCKQWAASGECKKNSEWMSSNCCNSCRAIKSSDSCSDKDDRCKQWAASGECKKNLVWMSSNCCKSCKGQKACTDKHRYCKIWVKDGLCKTQENIRKLCCSMCAKAAQCTDKHRYCKIWVKDGLCKQENIRKLCCSMCSKQLN